MAIQTLDQALTGAQLFQGNAALYSFIADTSGSFAALSIATSLSGSFPGNGYFRGERLRRVTFIVDQDNQLVLRQNSLLAPDDRDFESYPIVLAKEVSVFQLEFWDGRRGEYIPEWLSTNQLPQVVRVTLGFGSQGRYSKRPAELVSRVVRIPSNTSSIRSGTVCGACSIRVRPWSVKFRMRRRASRSSRVAAVHRATLR